MSAKRSDKPASSKHYATTLRTLKVAWLNAQGVPATVIAERLWVSTRTIVRDIRWIREKGAPAIKRAAQVLPALSLLLLCSCSIPGVDHRSQGSIDSQKAYERSKTNAAAPVNLLPPVSTRAVVSHAPPAPVTNLVVTWETPGDFTPFLTVRGQTNNRSLVTWIEERTGSSWYQRTPANAPQATNAAVISNTNKSGLLRAALGWK